MGLDLRIGRRGLSKVVGAAFALHHYKALVGMVRVYPELREMMGRYVLARGTYPYVARLRTPMGSAAAKLCVHDDVLTLNEIFCREDYPAGRDLGVVVDLGSNIGLSALFFLTRNASSRCYLFEPVPTNQSRLRENLAGLEGRYVLSGDAVAARAGEVEFGVEPTGRYGGIGIATGTTIRVRCRHVNDVLEEVLRVESRIDVLKIDTEGQEVATVTAIDPSLLRRIRRIYAELGRGVTLEAPVGFKLHRSGTAFRFYNMKAD